MNRKQLEECAWSKTPKEERRSQIERYDWTTKKTVTKRLKGNEREVRVFDPSGHTPGTMSPFVPLWSLYSDELEQRCKEEVEPKLRAPYNRTRADYTGDVESSPGSRATAEGISGRRHATHATMKKQRTRARKKSAAQLDREIAEVVGTRPINKRKNVRHFSEWTDTTGRKHYAVTYEDRSGHAISGEELMRYRQREVAAR
jgi:hypothetical protein